MSLMGGRDGTCIPSLSFVHTQWIAFRSGFVGMIVSGLMSAFAKPGALATYVTTLPPLPSLFPCDIAQYGLSTPRFFAEIVFYLPSWFPFSLDVITWKGIVTLLMGTKAENGVKWSKYDIVGGCLEGCCSTFKLSVFWRFAHAGDPREPRFV